jgi:hypothetical protein
MSKEACVRPCVIPAAVEVRGERIETAICWERLVLCELIENA